MAEPVAGELPRLVRLLSAPAALLPIGPLLTRAVRDLARRRPRLFERIAPYRRLAFVIEPTDLDFAFVIRPDGPQASVRTLAKRAAEGEVRVRGPLLALLGLLDGTFDGDALFFSRTITVEGRTDALVALRNAIEDADLKPADLLGLSGRAGEAANRAILGAIAAARSRSARPVSPETAGASS